MASARGFALLGLRFMAGISCKVIRWAAPWIFGVRTRLSLSVRGVWALKSSWQEPHFLQGVFRLDRCCSPPSVARPSVLFYAFLRPLCAAQATKTSEKYQLFLEFR